MQLKLNCTVAGKQISSKYQLSWYHGTQRLTNITVALSNGTIQLIIHRVSWDNNGTYVCKETAYNDVRPKHVMVTVGGELSSGCVLALNLILLVFVLSAIHVASFIPKFSVLPVSSCELVLKDPPPPKKKSLELFCFRYRSNKLQ